MTTVNENTAAIAALADDPDTSAAGLVTMLSDSTAALQVSYDTTAGNIQDAIDLSDANVLANSDNADDLAALQLSIDKLAVTSDFYY